MKRFFSTLSLRAKLLWIVSLSSLTTLLTCGVFIAWYERSSYREVTVGRLRAEADILGLNCASALLFRDEAAASATLETMKANPEIVAATLYDANGRTFASYAAPGSPAAPGAAPAWEGARFEKDGILVMSPVVYEGRRLGDVFLRTNLRALEARLRSFATILVLVAAVSFCLALLISYRYQVAISRPLQSLAETARRVSDVQDFSVRAPGEGEDEIGLLVKGFNSMLGQIERRDAELVESRESLERRVEDRTQALQRELEERRRAEEEIHRLNAEKEVRLAELTSLNREIAAFSYSVSHDLRAPLRHINGFVGLLKENLAEKLDPESLRYLDVISSGAIHMGRLIDDLLSFSHMSRTEMSERTVDAERLVREVITEVTREAGGREIVWNVGPLGTVTGDASMLRVVFVNLLSNAVKYTRGRAPARIDIGAERDDGGNTVIRVEDNGVGFDMKYADKLFGVFQRLHRAEDFEGTGIGLATVQRIVQRHGGRVGAESVVGRGSTFFLTLRTAPAPA